MLICAPDYILKSVDFKKYIHFSKGRSTTIVKEENNIETLKHGSCMQLGNNRQIIRFEEKPLEPFSNLFGVPYYCLEKSDVKSIRSIPSRLRDNLGQLVAALVDDSKIFAYQNTGNAIHLTTKRDYLSFLNEKLEIIRD
jgi:ADP-glucose pyrophosphorylase